MIKKEHIEVLERAIGVRREIKALYEHDILGLDTDSGIQMYRPAFFKMFENCIDNAVLESRPHGAKYSHVLYTTFNDVRFFTLLDDAKVAEFKETGAVK